MRLPWARGRRHGTKRRPAPAGPNPVWTVPPAQTATIGKALAITGTSRSSVMPDLPTVAEAGVPGYSAGTWYGVFLPARTSPEITTRLSNALRQVLAAPSVKAVMAKQGAEAVWDTPQEFTAFTEGESAKWGKLIHDLGIKVE